MTPRERVLWHDVCLVDDAQKDDSDKSAGPGADGLGGVAVEQFQRAALDAVRAARALLDAAESVIEEPAALEAMVKTLTSVAKSAADAVSGFMATGAAADPGATDDGPHDGFERISVD